MGFEVGGVSRVVGRGNVDVGRRVSQPRPDLEVDVAHVQI
jgi:hypothetical protein